MKHALTPALLALGLLAVAGTASANATKWSRETVHGGRITRSISGGGLIYSGQTTRTGPNGGTYTSTATCLNGVVDRCRRGYSATGPAGQAIAGHRASARGPFRVRSAGSFTAPRGNTLIGVHRRWR